MLERQGPRAYPLEVSKVPLSALMCSLAFMLGADPSSASPAPPLPLPRSSIAAVLAHRGELGLEAAQVKQLEARDGALQKEIADLRERLAAVPSRGRAGGGGRGGGGGMGGRHGGGGGRAAQDPAARASDLQAKIDDADTSAWLAAEALLQESQRERARAIAEKYREALADEREAKRVGH
jgi:hypothetical protein